MGIDALTHRDDGTLVIPHGPTDWADWISATAIRNHVLGDPLLDWLDLYGSARGYPRDDELDTHDPRTDFTAFIFDQGHRFEAAVLQHLGSLVRIVTIAPSTEGSRDLRAAERTFEAMIEGAPVIYQAVLRDPEHETYGTADLLVRSDVLRELFPDALTAEEAAVTSPHLSGPWHYRVVDVKFTTLHLLAGGELANQGSAPAYKAQLFIYNRALGRLQGYEPPVAFLLGRGWEQQKARGFNCMERLAPVSMAGSVAHGEPISSVVTAACNWIHAVRRDGASWTIAPTPSRRELYPDFGNQQDGPWHHAKRQIAVELEDLTLLWQVGVPGREEGHSHGLYRWTDPRVTPALVGVSGQKRVPVLQALLDMNRATDGPVVSPARIKAAEDEWRPVPPLEFYVDFETVSDLADDFTHIPQRGGQPLIFMIGCGHIERGEWRFECFVADTLTEAAEAEVIHRWLSHMAAVRERVAPGADEPRVVHWSPAEAVTFESAYNSAKARHPENAWPTPRWFDYLNRVVKSEPVVIRGAMAFGLKAIAKALQAHGFIETLWGDGPADGLGAMVGAWWSYGEAARLGAHPLDIDLMRQIVQYNEVDCRVMWESISYFRASH